MQELADKIWANTGYHSSAAALRRAWIAKDTGHDDVDLPPIDDVVRVVQSAAVLACSNKPRHRSAAYVAVTSAYELMGTDQLPLDQATRVVLSRLGNFPALSTRTQVRDAQGRLPLSLLVEEVVGTEAREVRVGDRTFLLTDFQHRLWTKLSDRARLAVAAPTSAGKSFVLQNFLASRFAEGDVSNVAFVVPTRALIAQVSKDLRQMPEMQVRDVDQIDVVTVPIEGGSALPSRAIFVMTQERLQLLLAGHPALFLDMVVVDEAQSIADKSRGILLQWVLEEMLTRSSDLQILFASPGVRNLGVFGRALGLSDVELLPSDEPTVAQNFLPVRIVDGKNGVVELYLHGEGRAATPVASRELGRRTVTRVEKLVNVSVAFGRGSVNIVYANGAGDAETIALRLAEELGERPQTPAREVLASLVADAVHPSYALVDCVRKGVGFHYSNIPTQVRQAVENAVADGVLDYLVCTSTLLQGVNLPAKNVFMCRPEKGEHVPMESVDFWNLAGRAGRLLKEFQGNIFLIEYDNWKIKPLDQPRSMEIVPSIESGLLSRTRDLLRAIRDPAGAGDEILDATFVRLLHGYKQGRFEETLDRVRGTVSPEDARVIALRDAVAEAADGITLSPDVLRMNPSVSAHRQQQLYRELRRRAAQSEKAARALLPRHPRDKEGVYESYASILQLCHTTILHLRRDSRFHRFIALIALWWMQGRPLPFIVQNQLQRNPDKDRRWLVRKTLELVERDVRFQCVRLLSCYTAVLAQVLRDTDRSHLIEEMPTVPLFLEVGASDRTMISLMAIGVSRVVATKLAPRAPSRELDVDGVRDWLRFRSLDSLGLSQALQDELADLLSSLGDRPPVR